MSTAKPCLLTVNGGSSSVKFALFEFGDSWRRTVNGSLERIGLPDPMFRVHGPRAAENFSRLVDAPHQAAAVNLVMEWVTQQCGVEALAAVGHRVVHAGPDFIQPQRVSAGLVEALRRFSPVDPAHLPAELMLIEAFGEKFPDLPQVACFDTTFHEPLPDVARMLPIPRRYQAQGVRRYGFHGLSYAHVMQDLVRHGDSAATSGRVIAAHLGNGASLAAVRHGKSIDTSMGFSPSSGLPMSTRSGDLDPGLVAYLAHAENMGPREFSEMMTAKSGLLGLAETSSDMRDLLRLEPHDQRAAEAIALFCYEVRKRIGAYAAALGGLDTLVFTGGIGQNAPVIRSRICDGLDFLGVQLDGSRNQAGDRIISADQSPVNVAVIPADEERMIAVAVSQVLALAPLPIS